MSKKSKLPHIVVYTGGRSIPSLPFHGELMTCFICGAQHRSNPKEESNWTCYEYKAKRAYMCPNCWSIPNIEKIFRYLARKKQ